MSFTEYEGKDIDEAIEKACEHLSVPREKLNIEIISPGSSGLFGFLGAKKAVIKAGLLILDVSMETYGKRLCEKSSVSRSDKSEQNPEGSRQNLEAGLKAKELLTGILERMELGCSVELREESQAMVLNIIGEESGLLIGKRGQNLDALQYLLNKAVHRSDNGTKIILVDAEGYRKRREESLVALAEELARKVKKTKKAITVAPMNTHSRRIMHLALQDDAAVITRSRGEGEYRNIVIMPAKIK